MTTSFRIERDSMGELRSPPMRSGAHRPSAPCRISHQRPRLPRAFIGALGLVKQAAARANTRLELLKRRARAIDAAAAEVPPEA